MAKTKILLDHAGMRELLRSDEAENMCRELAEKAQRSLSQTKGYVVTTYKGRGRVNASVYASSNDAKRENAKENKILKAVMAVKEND